MIFKTKLKDGKMTLHGKNLCDKTVRIIAILRFWRWSIIVVLTKNARSGTKIQKSGFFSPIDIKLYR